MKNVNLFTDGACKHNPGPGGYGVVLLYDSHRKEMSGGYRRTTNNRMEIMAAIVGLEALKEPCQVTLTSDSQYLVNAIEKGWAAKWQANGWKRNSKEKAINPDLWERLLDLCKTHKVKFQWVRGHAGHAENERCDELATEAAQGSNLDADEIYEKTSP
jgi:ribonuclease HI